MLTNSPKAEFIKKQHAVMGQGDFPGPGFGAAAHQRGARGRMMGLAKRSLRPAVQWHMAGHRLYGGHFQCLVFIEGGQQARQAAGQQGFACAWRPGKQQVVTAGRGHQQRPFGRKLALDIAQVGIGLA